MVRIKVTLSLTSPLSLGETALDATERARQYVSGAALRGAVGTLLARACGHAPGAAHTADCEFGRVFLRHTPPRFGPAYPAHPATRDGSRLLPYTARTCKHYPGFSGETDEDEHHGIVDTLFVTWRNDLALERGAPIAKLDCEVCRVSHGQSTALVRAQGFYEEYESGRYVQPRLRSQRLTRAATDRRRMTAADQRLYTLEVVREQMDTGRPARDRTEVARTTFVGYVWASGEELSQFLLPYLRAVKQLGGDSSRGLGWVTVQAELDQKPGEGKISSDQVATLAAAMRDGDWQRAATGSDLVSRLASFNRGLQQALAPEDRSRSILFFSVDLLSDTIWPVDGHLGNLAPDELHGAKRVAAVATSKIVSGWNSAVGLMRPPLLALGAGSVFLYRLDHADNHERLVSLVTQLSALEQHGVGLERERGYGWIQICSPFHLEVSPK